MRQVVGGDQATALLHGSCEFPRKSTMVEIIWLLGDAFERPGQVGLAEEFSRLVVIAVALKYAARFGELRQMAIMQILGFVPSQGIALARQLDGGSDHLLEGKLAIFFLGVDHARHGSRDADRLEADLAGTFNDVTLGVEVHVARRRGGSLLAIVDKVRRAIGHANEHEASATDISGCRMHYGQRETGRDRGVDGVAASPHDLNTGMGS